jgi:GAF domain-containing protein
MTEPIPDLINTLTTLNEIGTSINRLATRHDLAKTLELIVTGAVRVVRMGQEAVEPGLEPSAVIWIYDAAEDSFDRASRVSAGEPEGASIDDFPRPEGLGRQAIHQKRRLLSYEVRTIAIHPAKGAAGAKVMACSPLMVGEEVVGLLYVYHCENRPFSETELLLLDHFVQLASMAVYHGRQVGGLSRALTRKMREMEKLNRAAYLISSRSNLTDTLNEILSMGLDMTAAQYGSFEWYDKKQNLLVTKALAGGREQPADEPPLRVDEASVVGWVASRRQSLRIPDLQALPWREIYQPLLAGREMRSELAVPVLRIGGGLAGVLNIESPLPNAFTEEDQRLLETLAGQAVIAIQEIHLLDALQEITQGVLTASENNLFKLIIDRACDLINVSEGFIWTLSAAGKLNLRQSTIGNTLEAEMLGEDSFTQQALRLRQPVAIDDVRTHPEARYRALAQERGWGSAIIVPLLALHEGRRPVGVFTLYASRLHDFSDWDKKLLTCLANHAAIAIHNAEQLALLKQAQERQVLAETFAAVGDMGANLLHQLNNKLGAVSVRIQGIEVKCERALESWPYLAEGLQEIKSGVHDAMRLVRDSLTQLQPMPPQPVALLPCIQRVLRQLQPPPAVKVSLVNLEQLPRAWAGEKQMEMVFYNLIDNALRAMDQQGELILEGQDCGLEVAITVKDTGPGIPVVVQQKIFEFIAGAPPTSSIPPQRLGFGLWWVRTFVDRFGGRVTLNSVPGQGTAFTIWLPAEKDPESA